MSLGWAGRVGLDVVMLSPQPLARLFLPISGKSERRVLLQELDRTRTSHEPLAQKKTFNVPRARSVQQNGRAYSGTTSYRRATTVT